MAEKQLIQKANKDRHLKERTFQIGDTVYARNFGKGMYWQPGVIFSSAGSRSFNVKLCSNEVVLRRHLDHIRVRHATVSAGPADDLAEGSLLPLRDETPVTLSNQPRDETPVTPSNQPDSSPDVVSPAPNDSTDPPSATVSLSQLYVTLPVPACNMNFLIQRVEECNNCAEL